MSRFLPADAATVQDALASLKRRHLGKKGSSNYFLNPLSEVANLGLLETEHSVCFMHDEWDFSRFYVASYDLADLQCCLNETEWPPVVVVDWISKQPIPVEHEFLTNLGFHCHAIYQRIICSTFRQEVQEQSASFARDSDREEIHALLFRVFDKYADHIPSLAELDGTIKQKQVLVNRSAGAEIDGLVIFPIKGQTCNFNFLYNSKGPAALVHLLQNFYGILSQCSIQSGFSWVRRTRPLVLRLHQSFGWRLDGLVDHIYMR